MRIVQISDTHLSHMGGVMNENFALLVDYVNSVLKPDLVINTGDLVMLSPDSVEDREFALQAHEAFDAPVRIVPGNHDVGMPGATPWMGIAATTDRVSNYRSTFGSDRFLVLPDSTWALLGMNSEILSSGLAEEAAQWAWLEEVAEEIQGRCLAIFLHRPFWSPIPDFPEHDLALSEHDRERLLTIFTNTKLKLVASGHLHRYLCGYQGDTLSVSGPSSAFIVRGGSLGVNQLGVVEYRINGEGIEAYFRSVETLVEDEPFAIAAYVNTMAAIEASAVPVH